MKKIIKQILQQVGLFEIAKITAYHLFGYDSENYLQKEKMKTFYSQFVKKGDLCFDIGANVGSRTEIFVSLQAKVVSVEPQSACLQELHRKFKSNKNVMIVAKGVSDEEGFANLAVCENASVLSTMSETWMNQSRFSDRSTWDKVERVSVSTLNSLIKVYGLPVFCKIDVEGFEEKVIRGLTRPIPVISFEFAKELLNVTGNCASHITSIGDYKFNFSIGESMELLFPIWVSANYLIDKLDQHEDPLLWGDVYAKL
jgi:FkbM family methyltransferase